MTATPTRHWTWAPRSKTAAACPACDTIHGADATAAVDRFNPAGASGYRSRLGGPVRGTREEAGRDYCLSVQRRRADALARA